MLLRVKEMPGNDVFARVDGEDAPPRSAQEEKVGRSPDFARTNQEPLKGSLAEQFSLPKSRRRSLSMLRRLPVLAPSLDDQVEHRDEEQVEHGRHDHPAENGGTDRVSAVLSGPAREHQRHNT